MSERSTEAEYKLFKMAEQAEKTGRESRKAIMTVMDSFMLLRGRMKFYIENLDGRTPGKRPMTPDQLVKEIKDDLDRAESNLTTILRD